MAGSHVAGVPCGFYGPCAGGNLNNLPREPHRRQMNTDGAGSSEILAKKKTLLYPGVWAQDPLGTLEPGNFHAFDLKTPKTHCNAETMLGHVSGESDASQFGKNLFTGKEKDEEQGQG